MPKQKINDKEKSTNSFKSRKRYFGGWRIVDGKFDLFFSRSKLSLFSYGIYGRRRSYEYIDRKKCYFIKLSKILCSINCKI